MGGSFDVRSYGHDDRSKIDSHFKGECENSRIEDGCSYPGTIAAMNGIAIWEDRKFASQHEAEEWLSNNHDKWDDATAVSFMLPVAASDRDRKRIEKANLKVAAVRQKRDELSHKIRQDFTNAKSKMVGCKGCDSRFNRARLVTKLRFGSPLQCILCNTSFVSPTLQSRLQTHQAKLDVASEALREARKPKASEKKGWVVGGWCSS